MLGIFFNSASIKDMPWIALEVSVAKSSIWLARSLTVLSSPKFLKALIKPSPIISLTLLEATPNLSMEP